jgi:hypothetical protein
MGIPLGGVLVETPVAVSGLILRRLCVPDIFSDTAYPEDLYECHTTSKGGIK